MNANVALVSGMSVHGDEAEALRRGLDGFRFFGYSLGHYASFGAHQPTLSNFVGELSRRSRTTCRVTQGMAASVRRIRYARICAATSRPASIRSFSCSSAGNNKHEHICESLELFASAVQPEFKMREAARAAEKERELAPFIAAALARKQRMAPIAERDIPTVEAFGRHQPRPAFSGSRGRNCSTRVHSSPGDLSRQARNQVSWKNKAK